MGSPLFEHALDDFHDAACGLIGWEDALQSMTEALGARSCVLIPLDQDLAVKRRIQLESRSHARFTSIWLDRIDEAPDPHTSRPGNICFDRFPTVIEDQITTGNERRELPYYRSIAIDGNRAWWASIRFRTRSRTWALPLYRTDSQGPFTVADARRLDGLVPAIRRAVGFAETVIETSNSERLETLDSLGCPGFLLDGSGRVLQWNRAAEQIIGPELWLNQGRLVSDDRGASRTLRSLCARPLGRSTERHSSAVLLRDSRPWMLAQVSDLSPLARDVFSGGWRLLLLRPLNATSFVDTDLLRLAFGLTRTEARLASELTNGPGLEAGCEALGIGRETGRTHLRSIFRKTQTSSQAELAALLNRLSQDPPA